jgi:hypothetical protein
MLSSFLLRRAFHGIQVRGELRTHPFDVKLMLMFKLVSGSYGVKWMVEKATKPFSSWILKMSLLSPVQLFFQFYLRMTGRKDARTLRKPVKRQASNSLFLDYDLQICKAQQDYFMSGEVGWHSIYF